MLYLTKPNIKTLNLNKIIIIYYEIHPQRTLPSKVTILSRRPITTGDIGDVAMM